MTLPWYKDGLKFECTGCGKCCTGAPGYVWVTEEEILAMAEDVALAPEEFVRRYVRLVGERLSLRETERGGEYDCIFLHGNKCQVYDSRPSQCRTFPWWARNLESQDAWMASAQECEGINKADAPHFSCEEIEKLK